jgi:hypothetical protein
MHTIMRIKYKCIILCVLKKEVHFITHYPVNIFQFCLQDIKLDQCIINPYDSKFFLTHIFCAYATKEFF